MSRFIKINCDDGGCSVTLLVRKTNIKSVLKDNNKKKTILYLKDIDDRIESVEISDNIDDLLNNLNNEYS